MPPLNPLTCRRVPRANQKAKRYQTRVPASRHLALAEIAPHYSPRKPLDYTYSSTLLRSCIINLSSDSSDLLGSLFVKTATLHPLILIVQLSYLGLSTRPSLMTSRARYRSSDQFPALTISMSMYLLRSFYILSAISCTIAFPDPRNGAK